MTRALILAAGQGVRLRPLTDDKPKCLIRLLGKSLLQRQVETLKKSGINNIHIVTGYRADQIEALKFPTSINSQFASSNMVESLFSAIPFIQKEGDLIISYGDIVYQRNNLQSLLNCDDEIAVMIDINWLDLWRIRQDNPLDDAETLVINKNGHIDELGRKPVNYEKIEGQYTGLIKVRSDMLNKLIEFYNQLDRSAEYDGQNFYNMYMTSFLQLLIDKGWKVRAVLVNSGWLEIDTLDDLTKYESMAKEGKLEQFYRPDN